MKNSFDETEKLVLDFLCKYFGASYRRGEDPPDAYLKLPDENEIAVEISALEQQVRGKNGSQPRLSGDRSAEKLVNELNKDSSGIPDGRYVVLTLFTPINKPKEVKSRLQTEIKKLVDSRCKTEVSLNIPNNEIKVQICHGTTSRKIVGLITNQCFSARNIDENAWATLEERISVKAKKYSHWPKEKPIWLALLNNYHLAGEDVYRRAFSSFSGDHPFEKILLISRNGSINVLYERI